MTNHSAFLLACVLLAIAVGIVDPPRADAASQGPSQSTSSSQDGGQGNTSPPSDAQSPVSEFKSQSSAVAVFRFAVESQPSTAASALSAQACPQSSTAVGSPSIDQSSRSVTIDPKILDSIAAEMQKKLSKKMIVLLNPDPAAIPTGGLIITGCITQANKGNAVKRLIGMNVGASRLGAHVVALSHTKDGWSPIDTFDIQVKGGNVLPPVGPVGLALNTARDTHLGLSADAKKLADRILKKLSTNRRKREQQAKNG